MHTHSEEAPLGAPARAGALWNPVAAICWSVVFTPAFGAWIVMHNWRLLGDAAQARSAGRWLAAALVLLGLRALADALCARLHAEPVLVQWVSLLFGVAWCTGCALPQLRALRALPGRYARRAWDGPLVVAVVAGCGYWLAASACRWLLVSAT